MKQLSILALTLALTFAASAQNKLLTIQEAVLKGRTALAPKRLTGLAFIPDSKKLYYIDKTDIKILSAETGKELSSLSMSALNKKLAEAAADTLAALEKISWKNGNEFYFNNKKGEWLYSTDKATLAKSEPKFSGNAPENMEESGQEGVFSYVENNNVFVSVKGQVKQVTDDGSYQVVNGKSVHRDEFGITKGTFWSPKGNLLAYYRMDQSDVTDYPIIDWTTYPAGNKNIKYPMAGNKSHYVTLYIYDVRTGTSFAITTAGPKDQYLTNVAWSPDEKRIYMAILNREQNH